MAVDADLAAGRHAQLIGELDALVAEHPLRERLHGQRMLALYRSGRQSEALEAYRQARAALVEQIGVEPGAELRQLHEQILAQDPALDLAPPRSTVELRPGIAPTRRPRAVLVAAACCCSPGSPHSGSSACASPTASPPSTRTRWACSTRTADAHHRRSTRWAAVPAR